MYTASASATSFDREVAKAEDRKLNVLSWLWQHYRASEDTGMAQEMRRAYHELRHADSTILEMRVVEF